jgi:hypothetical protein
MSTDVIAIRNPKNFSVRLFKSPALETAETEIARLNKQLDLACQKLAERTEENVKLNRMLDTACDELKNRTSELKKE